MATIFSITVLTSNSWVNFVTFFFFHMPHEKGPRQRATVTLKMDFTLCHIFVNNLSADTDILGKLKNLQQIVHILVQD